MLQLSLPRGGAVPHLHHPLQGPLQHWLPSYLFGNKLKLTTFLKEEKVSLLKITYPRELSSQISVTWVFSERK